MDNYNFGLELRKFLDGILKISYKNDSNQNSLDDKYGIENSELETSNSYGNLDDNLTKLSGSKYELWGSFNQAKTLIPGHLLVIISANNTCYQVDPENGNATILFQLSRGPRSFFWKAIADKNRALYCSISGTLVGKKYGPYKVKFGTWGAVLKVDYKLAKINVLAEGEGIVDPHGLQLRGDKIIVSDFNSFDGPGQIYEIDKESNKRTILSAGGLLKAPVSSFIDNDGVIWVANVWAYENDGEVIRIDPNGKQTVLVPKGGRDSGQIMGILQSYHKDELIVFKGDWPWMINGSIFLVNKITGKTEVLFKGTPETPFFPSTSGELKNNILWFGEGVTKKLIAYDIQNRVVVNEIDLKNILGGYLGMIDGYDGIENVSVVPDFID